MKKYTHSQKFKNQQGFTVVELLFVVAIVVIVAAFGMPEFKGTMQNARITSQVNQTLGLIAFARSEAAKRPGTTITVCASSSTEASTPTCNSTNWEDGWLVFSDINADQAINDFNEDINGNGDLDIGEDINSNGTLETVDDELLRIGEPLEHNTLRTFGFTNNGSGFIEFDSNGIPDSTGTFIVCDVRGEEHAKSVVISVIGHARIATDDNTPEDNIVNDHLGVNITCPSS